MRNNYPNTIALTRTPGYLISTVYISELGRYETMVFVVAPSGQVDWTGAHCERVGSVPEALTAHSRAVEKFLSPAGKELDA